MALAGLSVLTSSVRHSSFLGSAYQLKTNSVNRKPWKTTNPSKQERGSNRNYRNLAGHEEDPPKVRKYPSSFGLFGTATKSKIPVSTVQEFHEAVFDQEADISLVRLSDQREAAIRAQVDEVLAQNHDVLQLMKQRFETGSAPGHRQDNATLALAIEGGGMRGCVSAGMAAAITALGLTDSIDSIYGSSAGSVIGSYMVSRQMCVDVYVDILPAAKRLFVCKKRMVKSIARSLVDVLANGMRRNTGFPESLQRKPGMNISFVLDSIMGQDHGVRPLDIQRFEQNSAKQRLRVVASCLNEEGQMISKCFGAEDFFGEETVRRVDGRREGLFACLEASMTVPGATGPPVEILHRNATTTESIFCFDAFCFEPIPYRSAVEEGATHVLALCSRPVDFQPKTKPGVYEKTVAPLYFHSHGHHKVATYFENGGQLFVYAEDLLTLQDAKRRPHEAVMVPPPKICYGLDNEKDRQEAQVAVSQRHQEWKEARLFPIQVPLGTAELGTLEQDKDAVLLAVRGGFSAAFDLLAPIVGLDQKLMTMSGEQVAELVFPDTSGNEIDFPGTPTGTLLDDVLLQTKVNVPGEPISWEMPDLARGTRSSLTANHHPRGEQSLSHTLLMGLPGFQDGRYGHLAKGLRYGSTLPLHHHQEQQTNDIFS